MAKPRAWAFTDIQARREYRCYRRILAPFTPEERDVFEPGWRFWAALGLYSKKGGKP